MSVRQAAKRLALCVASILVFPLVAAATLEKWLFSGESWFAASTMLLSLLPGRTGECLRLAFYRVTLQRCSSDVAFLFGVIINHRTVEIGRFVTLGPYCRIGTATIGDHVLFGANVSVLSGKYQHEVQDTSASVTYHEPVFERVQVGDNSWIGEGAIVMADVGSRCIVAAGAVVFRSVPDGKLAVGNPARVVPPEFRANVTSDSTKSPSRETMDR